MAMRTEIRGNGLLPESYLRAVAAQVGVPSAWWDDAVQEMRLGIWKSGNVSPAAQKGTARRRAIDFVRWLGGRGPNRRGPYAAARLDINSHTPVRAVPLEAIDRILDLNAALARLTPAARATFRATVDGEPGPLSRGRRGQLRTIIREAVA